MLFVVYFTSIELKQLFDEGVWNHISDFWNYLDILPPILIISAEIISLNGNLTHVKSAEDAHDEHSPINTVRTLYAFTAIAMWLRFLYFFRIFRSTGYYIHMIVQVVIDMTQFFFIFSIVVLAFGHANYIISKNDGEGVDGDDKEIGQVPFLSVVISTYRTCIGDVQGDGINDGAMYSPNIGWFFLVLCTLVVLIVFLNLLISIIGSTFGKVEDSKAQMTYKDLVQLIVENQFLIGKEPQKTLNSGKYLMLVVPEDQDELDQQRLENSMKEIRVQMRTQHTSLVQKLETSSYQTERLLKTLKKVQEQVENK